MSNNKGFGALPNIEDIRIYDYETLPKKEMPAAANTITNYSISEDRLPRVLDQGTVGSCVAHSIIEVLETLYYVESGEKIKLSPGYLYGHHRDETWLGEGMITSNAIERTRNHGSVPEEIFNEHVEMPEMHKITASRPELEEFSEPYKIKGYVSFQTADQNKKWEQLKEAFQAYDLPMVAVAPTYFGGSHCIILYGFEEDKNGNRYLKFQNSWGESYGNGGRSRIPLDKVRYIYLLLDETVQLPFEDVPESAWHYKHILNVYSAGLINGMSEKEFDPEGTVTRAQLCAILDRLITKIDKKDAAMMESVYDYIDKRH